MKRTQGYALAHFGNALRECLGLDPLFVVNKGKQKPKTNAERFYCDTYAFPASSPRKRGLS